MKPVSASTCQSKRPHSFCITLSHIIVMNGKLAIEIKAVPGCNYVIIVIMEKEILQLRRASFLLLSKQVHGSLFATVV